MECFKESRTQIKMKEIKTFKVIQLKMPCTASNFLRDQRIVLTVLRVAVERERERGRESRYR